MNPLHISVRQNAQDDKFRKAQCEYWWPLLEMLWNPPTEKHWLKGVKFMWYVKSISFEQSPCIPNCVIIAAIRHGQALLLNRPELAAQIMQDFLWPKPFCAVEMMFLYPNEASWMPMQYKKNQFKIINNPACQDRNAEKCKYAGKRMSDKMWKVNDLLNYDRALQLEREVAAKRRTVKFIRIFPDETEETNCSICREPLHFFHDIISKLLLAAQRHQKLQNGGLLSRPDQNTIYHPSLPIPRVSKDETRIHVDCDVTHFRFNIIVALYKWNKIHNNDGHLAIMLNRCHHVFDDQCMISWMKSGGETCPLCRENLGETFSDSALEFTQGPLLNEMQRSWIPRSPLSRLRLLTSMSTSPFFNHEI